MDFVVKKQNHVLEKQKMMQVSRLGSLCWVRRLSYVERRVAAVEFGPDSGGRDWDQDSGIGMREWSWTSLCDCDSDWRGRTEAYGKCKGTDREIRPSLGGLPSGAVRKIARMAVVSMDVAHRRTARGAACAQKEQPKRKTPASNDGKDVTDDTLNRRPQRPDHTDTLAIRALPDT